jgi:UDP-glucose 4-epimerase
MNKTILVTGGTGFIGSHTVVELLDKGFNVIVIDNLSTSKKSVVDRINAITNKQIKFYEIDLLDKQQLEGVFIDSKIDAVIHFAGLKAVGESVAKPLMYYRTNIDTTLNVLEMMRKYEVKNIVFSSSATVYGMNNTAPFIENMPLSTTNPYGSTKLMIENILRDIHRADNVLNVALLRYFNPIGAHKSGMIGEDPQNVPNNLMPYIAQVGAGIREKLSVYGDDYDTKDGTGVRDYIHVVDLASGHVLALERLLSNKKSECEAYNLGAGFGYSVHEMIRVYEKAIGKNIPYEIVAKRTGDIATSYADTTKAKNELGFETKKTIDDMCEDIVKWLEFAKNNL